jgi:hypothetical protein
MYTIEERMGSGNEIKRHVFGHFSDDAWDSLWEELQVREEDWTARHETIHTTQQDISLLPEFPQISRLAYIDEGTVHFNARDLSEECVRLLTTLKSDATRHLLGDLLEAARSALEEETPMS